MKKLKYILIFILSIGLFNSCLLDDETTHDDYDQGPNLAGFTTSSTFASAVADGNEYPVEINMLLEGPTSMDVTSDITVTIGVDPASTAVEGTHYRLDNTTLTLKASDDHLGILTFTMLTDGIMAPLSETPVLILEVQDASGADNVVANGKKISIDLNYLCYSNLAGAYLDDNWGDVVNITEISTGYYEADYLTYFVSHYSWRFTDVCDNLTYAGGQLTDWGYDLSGSGSVDPVTGTITMTITMDGYFTDYTMTLTKL